MSAHACLCRLSGCLRSTLIALALLLSARVVHAQSQCTTIIWLLPCTTSNNALTISITISRFVELSVSPTSTALSVPTPADYNSGFVASAGPTVTVRANTPWTLSISAASATWNALNTQTEPARANKPCADLRWALAAGATFSGLTTSAVQIASGNRTTGTSINVFYQTMYSWLLDTPGTYTLPVAFTIVAP